MSDDTNPTHDPTHEACGECLITPAADFDFEPMVGLTINLDRGTSSTWLSWSEVQELGAWLHRMGV